MSVTVVTCVYGSHFAFVPRWLEAVNQLDPEPDAVIVASDRELGLPDDTGYLVGEPVWKHPQAFYLNLAILSAGTEWVWIHDIDDVAHPDALDGLETVTADVWQMGYDLAKGLTYVVPQLTAAEYLDQSGNPFVGASAIRTDVFREIGGFRDVAFQDWDLWRRLALAGATFETSGRSHHLYTRHSASRSATELTWEMRPAHVAEMLGVEEIHA